MSNRFFASAHRHGVSFLELLGCVVAVVGGIVLGALYYGVDLQQATVGALRYADVISPANQVAASNSPESSAQSSAVNAEAKSAEGVAVDSAAVPALPDPSQSDGLMLTTEQRAELTHEYWDELNKHMRVEAETRAIQAEAGAGIHDYLSRRSEGHRTASDNIDKLPLRGVDGHVAAFAERILAWHQAGAEMFAHARDLVTDAPTAQLSGPFAQQWQSAVTQHQMEERLLSEKHAAVKLYMDHAAKD